MNLSTVYPRNINELISIRQTMPLDSGTPDSSVTEKLDSAMLERLFGSAIIVNKTAARLCLAGLWLLYDHLEECHAIAQPVETPDGSYWHAIMHRREGDFSNSKYWYRRVGEHDIYPALLEEAKNIVSTNNHQELLDGVTKWDPFLFVDLCEDAIQRKNQMIGVCQQIQQVEWRFLFDHCYQKATAD